MKGILFLPDMLQAIRDGIKSETRRVINPQPRKLITSGLGNYYERLTTVNEVLASCKPRYKAGEVVYVKEPWRVINHDDDHDSLTLVYTDGELRFRVDSAGWFNYPRDEKRRSPMFMPEWAARLFLQVIEVVPERVQDITEEGALAEGCKGLYCPCADSDNWKQYFFPLWESIYCNRGFCWEANPWVWVYKFKDVEKFHGIDKG